MSLSIMERLALGKELSQLMLEQKSASVLQRMVIGKQIVEVMLKLGLAAKASEPDPAPSPITDDTPQFVRDFLAGAYVKESQLGFIDALRTIAGYVGQYLTLEQAKEQTHNWVSQNGYVN